MPCAVALAAAGLLAGCEIGPGGTGSPARELETAVMPILTCQFTAMAMQDLEEAARHWEALNRAIAQRFCPPGLVDLIACQAGNAARRRQTPVCAQPMPVPDASAILACRHSVEDYFLTELKAKVEARYTNLPPEALQRLVNQYDANCANLPGYDPT